MWEKIKSDVENRIFVTEVGEGSSCSLIGPDQKTIGVMLEELKEGYAENESKGIYLFEIDLAEQKEELRKLPFEQRMWGLWSKIVGLFAERIPGEDYEICYRFFLERTEWKDGLAIKKLQTLFENYTENRLQIALIMRGFEHTEEIFPREHTEEMFFRRLFILTNKSIEKKNLVILLASTRRVGDDEDGNEGLAHNMGAGSNIESAFPPIIL